MAIDHDAAIFFTKASVHTPSIKKFLTVSYLSSRRSKPSWWSEDDWAHAQYINNEVLPTYFKAKVAADEVLTVLSEERVRDEEERGVDAKERFCGISLRPGNLTLEKAGGVSMGKIGASGTTSRASVAEAVVQVLEQGARGWVDVLDGDTPVEEAVARVVREIGRAHV